MILAQVTIVCLDRYDLTTLEVRNLGIAYGVCIIFNMVELTITIYNYATDGLPEVRGSSKFPLFIDILDLCVLVINIADYVWKAAEGMYLY